MKMTKQETFDIVAKGLLTQGCKSQIDGDGHRSICVYQDGHGHKCAAGFLIPEDQYHPELEGTSMEYSVPLEDLLCHELGHDKDLVIALQRLHDAREPHEWFKGLTFIAKEFGLTMPEGLYHNEQLN